MRRAARVSYNRGRLHPIAIGFLLAFAVVTVLVAVYAMLLRPWHRSWGAGADEVSRELPGDHLVPHPRFKATRAIGIAAPPADVWPWLVQIGLGRGGFHSYELLERLGGIDVRNVERILPHLQSLEVGQEIKLHPSAPGLVVVLLELNEHLCTRTWKDEQDLVDRDPTVVGSFSLYLVRASADSCRLLVRTCKQQRRPRSRAARLFATFLEDPLDLVMEQRMLRTVRRLAQRRGV